MLGEAGWRFRCLAHEDELLLDAVASLHFLAFGIVLLQRFVTFMVEHA